MYLYKKNYKLYESHSILAFRFAFVNVKAKNYVEKPI